MKSLNCIKHFEHIHIIYEGAEVTIKYRESHQTLKLFKKMGHYGEDKVVVSSSGWFEYEHTIKRYESEYFCMLCNGDFLMIERPTRDNDYGDECVIVRITNKDV
jgi:hypothetical protein